MPTAATTEISGPACPSCGASMYDNRATKKNPKQPDYKCTRYKSGCEGVLWPAKPKPGVPPFLHNAAAEDAAELAGKIGQPKKPTMREAYKQLTEWVISDIVPLYDTEWGEGVFPPEATVAIVATLFIQACKSGKVE